VLPGSGRDPARLAREAGEAIEQLADRFGPFPYASLTIPWLPEAGGGIEYPSSILLASGSGQVLVHEVAHMWFYGMVGDSQFRDPWLDEAFASYAESVAAERPAAQVSRALAAEGDVGGSMAEFPDDRRYVTAVYAKGAAMLLTARERAGAAPFDAALRCYADAQAWGIATPADVGSALADLPAALAVLQEAGALDPEDLAR
jgi:Peptidase family M1 domain